MIFITYLSSHYLCDKHRTSCGLWCKIYMSSSFFSRFIDCDELEWCWWLRSSQIWNDWREKWGCHYHMWWIKACVVFLCTWSVRFCMPFAPPNDTASLVLLSKSPNTLKNNETNNKRQKKQDSLTKKIMKHRLCHQYLTWTWLWNSLHCHLKDKTKKCTLFLILKHRHKAHWFHIVVFVINN